MPYSILHIPYIKIKMKAVEGAESQRGNVQQKGRSNIKLLQLKKLLSNVKLIVMETNTEIDTVPL